jgi:hypothetical protein
MQYVIGSLFIEAAVVGVVCVIFLLLFVVAGIKQLLNDRD